MNGSEWFPPTHQSQTRRMKRLNLSCRRQMPVIAVLAVSLSMSSCASLEKARERQQEKIRRQQSKRYLTLPRPDAQISVSPDGLKIGSDHYTLTFHEDLLKRSSLDESKERQEIGHGALLYMESLYKYIHELFRIEPPTRRIGIVLYETFQGTTMRAITESRHQTVRQGNGVLKTVGTIVMHFPMAMFDQREVRAHELTHAFTANYHLPTWFTEGIAVFVQIQYAKGGDFRAFDLHENMKVDLDDVNAIQTWKGHASVDAQWGYGYSFSIVKKLYDLYGEEFYPEIFRLMEADKYHQQLPGEMKTSMLVYYMSQAAGEDLVPFFENLKFNVRQLTIADIESVIRKAAPSR